MGAFEKAKIYYENIKPKGMDIEKLGIQYLFPFKKRGLRTN